jgi:hypothetical protein
MLSTILLPSIDTCDIDLIASTLRHKGVRSQVLAGLDDATLRFRLLRLTRRVFPNNLAGQRHRITSKRTCCVKAAAIPSTLLAAQQRGEFIAVGCAGLRHCLVHVAFDSAYREMKSLRDCAGRQTGTDQHHDLPFAIG